ncbi:MucBP domain-containing protein, partial [Streptococcus suis]
MKYNTENNKQRFSIKKFKQGAASVLVGLLIAGPVTQSVAAETTASSTTEASNTATTETTETSTVASGSDATATSTASSTTTSTDTTAASTTTASTDTTAASATSTSSEAIATPLAGVTATAASTVIVPESVTVSINGQARDGNAIVDGSQVMADAVVNFGVNLALPNQVIKAGDTMTLQLPTAVKGVTQTTDITNAKGEVVATLTVDGTTAKLVFTDAMSTTVNNNLYFTFNTRTVGVSAANNDVLVPLDLTAIAEDGAGTTYSSGVNVSIYVSPAVNFGTSNRLWQATELYKMLHQSEVAIIDRNAAHEMVVEYTIDPDTQPYVRYDVDAIRTQGYNFLMGISRSNRVSINTLNNDLGITATVNDEGTKVTLTIPNLPEGMGINGGSIPVNLTSQAIAEQFTEYYNARMNVYVDGVLTRPDIKARNTYQFTNSSSSQQTTVVSTFEDADTGLPLEDPVVTNYEIGVTYETAGLATPPAGYKLVAIPNNASGTTTPTSTVVKYQYRKIGSVTVEHVLEDGTVLKERNNIATDEFVGTDYTTTALTDAELSALVPAPKVEEFADKTVTTTYSYELVETPANATGQVTEGTTDVTYTYKLVETVTSVAKVGSVTVEYVLEDGTVLKDKETVVADATVGTTYETKPLTDAELAARTPAPKVEEFADKTVTKTYSYELVETPANATGQVTEGATDVTYTYKLVETVTSVAKVGSVMVEYVLEDGTVLKDKETVVADATVGTAYTTTALTDAELSALVPAPKVEEFADKTVTTTYSYELVETPANA